MQLASQPSPLVGLPSSQAFAPATGRRYLQAVAVQLVSQPSPLVMLPSSQASLGIAVSAAAPGGGAGGAVARRVADGAGRDAVE